MDWNLLATFAIGGFIGNMAFNMTIYIFEKIFNEE
jgi:hypothetical protein